MLKYSSAAFKKSPSSNSSSLSDYVKLAKVSARYLENVSTAAAICSKLIKNLRVSFTSFKQEILLQIIEHDDFRAETLILQTVVDVFAELPDRIACLERLAMLFEKKTHNETLLHQVNEKLLSIDPKNLKALKYFKLIFSQNNEWQEVIRILRIMMESASHPTELFRVAQELAGVYLYQLDMPHEAIELLERYCTESPLDTSTILYDAYERLTNWEGCIRVLRDSLISLDNDLDRSILHYKIASLHEYLGDYEAAKDNFQKAAKLWPTFLEPIEGLINLNLHKQRWEDVLYWLRYLAGKSKDKSLCEQIKDAVKRLEDSMFTHSPSRIQ